MLGQSGSRSRFSSLRLVTNNDTTDRPDGLVAPLVETFLLCVGPDVVDGAFVAEDGRSIALDCYLALLIIDCVLLGSRHPLPLWFGRRWCNIHCYAEVNITLSGHMLVV